MTPSATPELMAERALRLAAGCSNGLLSGAVCEVVVDSAESAAGTEVAAVLRLALSRMGARQFDARRSLATPDYVFVTGDTSATRIAELMEQRVRGAERLPAIFVAVGSSPAADDLEAALGTARRWRRREPRAQLAEFRVDGQAVALAVPAAQLIELDERGRVAESAARIEWARRGMPATAGLARALGESGAVNGVRVGVSLVLEPKTSALALALRDAGAEVAVFSADGETDRAVATALAETGIAVFAPQLDLGGQDPERGKGGTAATGSATATDSATATAIDLDAANAAAVLDWRPELLIDDGSHLVRLAHTERPGALDTLRAASEETTSGVRPLIEMAAESALRIPVIAVNDARTKSEFDNRIGTGQSCVFAIADLLDSAAAREASGVGQLPASPAEREVAGSGVPDITRGVAGTHWVVVGYGPVGVGVARFAAALGATITVVERDAVRALQALHDGFESSTLAEALPLADVAVSATGVWHTLGADDLALLRPGAAVTVAGGIDDELALEVLSERGWSAEAHAPHLATWRAPGHTDGPLVLADGAGVNYTAGEGNPIEVMDLSFATQLSALARIAEGRDELGVHMLDLADERRVALAALAAHGGTVDAADTDARPGGAAQHWTSHRYRSQGTV